MSPRTPQHRRVDTHEIGARSHWAGRVAQAIGMAILAVVVLVLGFGIGRALFYRTPVVAGAAVGNSRIAAIGPTDSETVFPASSTLSPGGGKVEVPDVRGMRADEALLLMQTAGFSVMLRFVGASVTSEASRTIVAQTPPHGTVADAESTVTLSAPRLVGAGSVLHGETGSLSASRFTVCIDPGHQARGSELEPLGPGSKTPRQLVACGGRGVATGVAEYETALQLSVNLERQLTAAGVKVVMTRTRNDVTLSGAARASIANQAHADLLVSIHEASSPNRAESGFTSFYPARSRWTARYNADSITAAKATEIGVSRATGATDRGAHQRSDVALFDWVTVPAVLVEAGFLSNPVEDRLLSSPNYQDRVARGLTSGIMTYLEGNRR